jgi:hypothetical protein
LTESNVESTSAPWKFQRGDRWAIGLLVVVPLIVFAVPTLAGHPPIVADNLIQNFPLRVLVGKVIRSGHWPLWNPLADSGTPLLASLNAGAFYPATAFFVILPGALAWLLNISLCYVAAGTGVYVLLRWLKIASLPALMAAATYAFFGAMAGQMVHLGVIQGQGWLPWIVLAILVLAKRLRTPELGAPVVRVVERALWPFIALTVLSALIFLTGEPRAIADFEMVGLVLFVYVVAFVDVDANAARRWLVGGAVVVASLLGAAISAAQTLPGNAFISLSQRSDIATSFFGSGSWDLHRTILLFVPYFYGGAGLFKQPSFFIDYNLPELTGYIGLIGMVALFAVIARVLSPSRRTLPRFVVLALVLAGFGLLLAWGQFTPFVHVMEQIPLLNKTRLQSRNIAIFDLGVVVLLGWFVDEVLRGRFDVAALVGKKRWVTLLPLLFTVAILIVLLIIPGRVEQVFGATSSQSMLGRYLTVWFIISLVIAGTALAIFWLAPKWSRAATRNALVVLLAIDGIFFLVATETGLVSGTIPVVPSASFAASQLGTQGRFALIDPTLTNGPAMVALGQPNTNVFTNLPSIQGYGSLIGNTYGAATNAHAQNEIDPCGLLNGTYEPLRLHSMALTTNALAPVIYQASLGLQGMWPQPGTKFCPGQTPVSTNDTRRFYFGQAMVLVSAHFVPSSPSVMASAATAEGLTVHVLAPNGTEESVPAQVTQTRYGWSVTFPTEPTAVGFVLHGPVRFVEQTSTVSDALGNVYSLNGQFQNAIDRASWKLMSTNNVYQVFAATKPLQPEVKVVDGVGTVRSVHDEISGRQVDQVTLLSKATVVRSEAYLPGWKVAYAPVGGGPSTTISVQVHGLVQAATIPAGRWQLTWSYHAPRFMVGLAISILATLVLLALVVWAWLVRRRSAS